MWDWWCTPVAGIIPPNAINPYERLAQPRPATEEILCYTAAGFGLATGLGRLQESARLL